MKSILVKHILFLLLVLGFSIDINAQTFVLDADQQNSGLKIIKSDKHQIKLSHQVNTFDLKDVDIQGVSMKQLDYGSSFIPGKEGAPD